MTIIAPNPNTTQHTSPLTSFDVLDIECALNNAAAADCTNLSAADRQALALLTYDRAICKALAALLIEQILDGTYSLPLDGRRARLLLRLSDRLPVVSDADVDAWLASRDADVPCATERMIAALVSYVASYSNDIGGNHMRSMLNTALVAVAKPDNHPDEIVRTVRENHFDDDVRTAGRAAHDMVERVRRDRLTAIDDANAAAAVAL